jgi:hypothetical protein
MKSGSVKIAALVFAAVLAIVQPQSGSQQTSSQQKPPDSPVPAKTVSGLGCVEAGVEAGCLVLRDDKTKKLYNLYFSMPRKPQPGMGIRFRGTKKDGVTICMQGEAINVGNWSRAELACSGHGHGEHK